MRNGMNPNQAQEFKKMEYRVDKNGDTTITLRSIKIRDISKWE